MPFGELLLEADSVSVQLDGQDTLDRVNLRIHSGEILTLIGPNGAGKTTLLRALLGLQRISAGNINRRDGLRIGYMPQRLQVSTNMPMSAGRFLRLSGKPATAMAPVLAETGTAELLSRPLHGVSGGEFQRILLARALLARPELLILDEPVQGVDVQGQVELYRLIGSLQRKYGCAVLMVSHDLHLVMAETDTVVCLNRHVCCQGHPESVTADPAFLELFGRRQDAALAMYSHHHDHHHDLHGDVRPCPGEAKRD